MIEQDIQVIGISMDTVADQRAFANKYQLPFPLLADTTGQICDAFRVEHPERKPLRETFLFKNGKLVHLDRKVKPKKQAEDILRRVQELQ